MQVMVLCRQRSSRSRGVGRVFRVFASTELATSLVFHSLPDLGLAADPRGVRSVDVSGKIALSGRSSLDLPLPFRALLHQRRCRPGRPGCNCLPCGFFPFDVFPVPGSHSLRRRPTAGYVPSQRFSRSQGLPPPSTCRPCFMPVPPVGFPLQGRSPPAEPFTLSSAVALLRLARSPATVPTIGVAVDAGCILAPSTILSRRLRILRPAPLQGLAPCERLFLRSDCLSHPGATTLLGFSSLGISPPLPVAHPGAHPLASFPSGAHARPENTPQSFRPTVGSA